LVPFASISCRPPRRGGLCGSCRLPRTTRRSSRTPSRPPQSLNKTRRGFKKENKIGGGDVRGFGWVGGGGGGVFPKVSYLAHACPVFRVFVLDTTLVTLYWHMRRLACSNHRSQYIVCDISSAFPCATCIHAHTKLDVYAPKPARTTRSTTKKSQAFNLIFFGHTILL